MDGPILSPCLQEMSLKSQSVKASWQLSSFALLSFCYTAKFLEEYNEITEDSFFVENVIFSLQCRSEDVLKLAPSNLGQFSLLYINIYTIQKSDE